VGNPKAACISYNWLLLPTMMQRASLVEPGSGTRLGGWFRKKDSKDNQMRNFTLFIAGLTIAAVVSFSFDAIAGSKQCKKGFTYSESSGKCIRKGGYRY
jgi:hypothetical protein